MPEPLRDRTSGGSCRLRSEWGRGRVYRGGGVPVGGGGAREAGGERADALRPVVECGVGVPPLLERQGRPELAYCDIGRHGHTSLSESLPTKQARQESLASSRMSRSDSDCETGPAGIEPATPGFGDRCSTN